MGSQVFLISAVQLSGIYSGPLVVLYYCQPCQVEELTDGFKRSLAEMENVRDRTRREIDTAKKFAIQVREGTVRNMAIVQAVPQEAGTWHALA